MGTGYTNKQGLVSNARKSEAVYGRGGACPPPATMLWPLAAHRPPGRPFPPPPPCSRPWPPIAALVAVSFPAPVAAHPQPPILAGTWSPGQSHLIFGTGSTSHVIANWFSKFCCIDALYKPPENLDAIALTWSQTQLHNLPRCAILTWHAGLAPETVFSAPS